MKTPILMYHSIGYDNEEFCVSPENFFKQLNFLKKSGYKTVSLNDLNSKCKKKIVITFDDGYEDVYKYALPILKELGFSAICFFVTNLIGKFNFWDFDKNFYIKKKLMNKIQIKNWIINGMSIGSHTKSHSNLSKINYKKKIAEIEEPILFFKKNFDINVNAFSYPYGRYDEDSLNLVKKNYSYGLTTLRSRYISGKFNFHQIPRIPVNRSCSIFKFFLKVNTIYEDIKYRN